ncbi:MAG: hypothetical protein AABY95_06900 [Pseudomonadota bacterium]
MNRSFFIAAGIAACAGAAPVFAEPPFSLSLTPVLAFGVEFGEAAQQGEVPLHFSAQFGMRSPLLWGSDTSRTLAADIPLLSVFQFGADRRGRLDLVRVLGRDMLAPENRLNETGESGSSGGNNWIWWTAGAVAAGAAVALTASSGGEDGNKSGSSGGGGDCVGLSGANVGPSVDPGQIDTSGCSVDGNVGSQPFRVP